MIKYTNPRKRGSAGFTLIELLVVIAIIGILAMITLGVFGAVKRKAQESKLKAQMSVIQMAIENYKRVNNSYPPSNNWVNGSNGAEIVYPPANWDNPYLPPANNLYDYLVRSPMVDNKKPFIKELATEDHNGTALFAAVMDVRNGGPRTQWHYNSFNPKFNKNSYDLWVEYGDKGDSESDPSDDNVKIISNWNQ